MKTNLLILLVVIISFGVNAQNSTLNVKGNSINNKINSSIEKRTIDNSQIGDLISLDEYGNYILATGSMFEKILGFTTSAPYVTPNKPNSPNGSRVEFIGIISIENGVIKKGDFLCPSKTKPGKVKKCSKDDHPYAVAIENADSDLQKIKVKVLGCNRTR